MTTLDDVVVVDDVVVDVVVVDDVVVDVVVVVVDDVVVVVDSKSRVPICSFETKVYRE